MIFRHMDCVDLDKTWHFSGASRGVICEVRNKDYCSQPNNQSQQVGWGLYNIVYRHCCNRQVPLDKPKRLIQEVQGDYSPSDCATRCRSSSFLEEEWFTMQEIDLDSCTSYTLRAKSKGGRALDVNNLESPLKARRSWRRCA
jgi:hypothetical protein